MDSTSIAMLVALVALVAMSGYFSATETAFTSLNRIRLKNKADNGDRRAARTLELAEDYDRLCNGRQVDADSDEIKGRLWWR